MVVPRPAGEPKKNPTPMLPEDSEMPSAPKWQRLPGHVQLKLVHLIADHLNTHGSDDYVELRDHPDFSPWFGTHLGHRGEKRFDRMVKSVRSSQPRKSARRSTKEPDRAEASAPLSPERLAWPAAKQLAYAAGAPIEEGPEPSVARQLAHVGAPSFEELIGGQYRRHRELEISLTGCVNELGEIVAPKLYKQYAADLRATTLLIAQLCKQYHDALVTGPVLEEMIERLLAKLDPEDARQIAADLSTALQQSTGLNAIQRAS